MAFYGAEPDSVNNRADTLFRLDSTHIAISVSGGLTFNTPFQNLGPGLAFSNGNGGNVLPTYVKTIPSVGYMASVGFEYLSKTNKNNLFFDAGIEVMYATCSGNIQANTITSHPVNPGKDTSVATGLQNLPYSLYVLTIAVPVSIYYKLSANSKHRLSPGLGIVLGDYLIQQTTMEGFSAHSLNNPLLMGKVSLRYDVNLAKKTGLSFEPFFETQLLGNTTRLMSAGIKIASI